MKLTLPKVLSLLRGSLTPNRPYHVQWFLTRRCNYRCISCSVWRGQADTRELSADLIKRGLDALRRLGVAEIVLSGGNPLLRDDIGEIIDYASRFFITTVYDNGSNAVEKLDALRNADFVAISLDTLNEKKNDYLKGVSGAWRRSMDTIKTLKENDVSVIVSPTISRLNLQEIVEFTTFFTDCGIPVLYCLYSYDYPAKNQLFGIGKKDDELEIADGKAMADLCDDLVKLRRRRDGIFITTKLLVALKQFFLNEERTWECRALQDFFVVNHLGRVAGCSLHEPMASVFELPDVWQSQRFGMLRKKYRKCTKCAYLCNIFYSLYSGVLGNMELIRDQRKNIRVLLRAKT